FRPSCIRHFDLDKFKPLSNYLKKGLNTRDKNVELLAWLIEFEYRPFAKYIDVLAGRGKDLSNLYVPKKRSFADSVIEAVTAPEPQFPENNFVEKIYEKIIELEYPSGVKLRVDSSDMRFIEKLLNLEVTLRKTVKT
ncbi:MAG: hypothetical protein J7502_19630, partial [Flavisolibacter sp.]|nr:hypothetical protein [Flavisolibacter sp.]